MILIVASKFDKSGENVVLSLIEGVTKTLDSAFMPYQVVRVPGAIEIPLAAQYIFEHDTNDYKAIIALGCVIKGETDHYDMVIRSVTDGLTRLALDLSVPVVQGILACRNKKQATERKTLGEEYAQTALKMIELLEGV